MRRRRLRRRQLKKQKKIIIVSSIVLLFGLSVGYSAFSTQINLNAKGNIKQKPFSIDKLKDKVVTSGDGLYADSTEDGRYVYKGAEPNNYIKLGDDDRAGSRIISVESDGTLKVIYLGEAGVLFDWDGNDDRTSTDSADYCLYNSDTQEYGCNVWGSKNTMLDSNGNHVTKMPREVGSSTTYNLPSSEAHLNTYLNSTWYNSVSTGVRDLITTHMFNVGSVKEESSQTLATDLSQEKAYKWEGKVGLLSVTDYVKASTNPACTSVYAYSENGTSGCYKSNDNWLNYLVQGGFLTITPYSSSSLDFYSGYLWGVLNYDTFLDYELSYFNTYGDYSSCPAFYLSSDITLTGSGT